MGGGLLRPHKGLEPSDEPIGESWEVSAVPTSTCIIRNWFWKSEDLNACQIIKRLQKEELVNHNATLKYTYCTIDVKFASTLEQSVTDRIWELILDTIQEIGDIISADARELLSAIIDVNPKFHKSYQMYNLYAA